MDTQIAYAVEFLLIAAVVVGCVVAVGRVYSRRRTAVQAEAWARLTDMERSTPGARRAWIVDAYQYAQTGTKAIIEVADTGQQQDSWFRGMRVRNGDCVLLTGSDGYGWHNHTTCRYVHPPDLLAVTAGDAQACYERLHHQGTV